jgi:FkbM family methyltransferase
MPQTYRRLNGVIRSLLSRFDIAITRHSTLEALKMSHRTGQGVEMLLAMPPERAAELLPLLAKSRSQLLQDLFVLSELGLKRDGVFVEFGAADGLWLSNTCLLEKEFGWTGVLAEPARVWHETLRRNRTASIETRCVWTESGAKLTFNEAADAEFSTIDTFSGSDFHTNRRNRRSHYEVETVSLNDLLRIHNLPKQVDYLSIDTEGSEYSILASLDFSSHKFSVITCEHNFTPMREKIYELLTRNGYVRKCERFSGFDDWYVLQER